jgi:hypothetical protein
MGQSARKASKEKKDSGNSANAHKKQVRPTSPGNNVKPSMETNNHPATPVGIPPIVQDVLRSPGQPMDPATRAFMESRFNQDFSRVRLHKDSKANESAQTMDANAYTAGRHVVFNKSQYSPGTDTGKRLLAHELAHVVQQSRGGTVPEIHSSAHHERDASNASQAIVSGQTRVNVRDATGVGIARDPIIKKRDPIVRKYLKYRIRTMSRWDKKLGRHKTPMSFTEYLENYGAGAIKQHHLIPQEMPRHFRWIRYRLRRLGIDIHKYNIPLPNYLHVRIHRGKGGGLWNREILAWFRNNPGFTEVQLRAQINRMLRKFNIPSAYRELWPRYGRTVTRGERFYRQRRRGTLPDRRNPRKPPPKRGQSASEFYKGRKGLPRRPRTPQQPTTPTDIGSHAAVKKTEARFRTTGRRSPRPGPRQRSRSRSTPRRGTPRYRTSPGRQPLPANKPRGFTKSAKGTSARFRTSGRHVPHNQPAAPAAKLSSSRTPRFRTRSISDLQKSAVPRLRGIGTKIPRIGAWVGRFIAESLVIIAVQMIVDCIIQAILGKVLAKHRERKMREIIEGMIRQAEPQVLAKLNKALQAKEKEFARLATTNPNASVYTNVGYELLIVLHESTIRGLRVKVTRAKWTTKPMKNQVTHKTATSFASFVTENINIFASRPIPLKHLFR